MTQQRAQLHRKSIRRNGYDYAQPGDDGLNLEALKKVLREELHFDSAAVEYVIAMS